MQTKLLLCTHGELEAACAICFVTDLKTQLRECEKENKQIKELLREACGILFEDHWCGYDDSKIGVFLNKPEIIKLLKDGDNGIN